MDTHATSKNLAIIFDLGCSKGEKKSFLVFFVFLSFFFNLFFLFLFLKEKRSILLWFYFFIEARCNIEK